MDGIFGKLAEARIREAIDKGELDNLPGKGKPLNLEELAFVPPELRAIYSIMKNANLVPEEVLMHKEIEELNKQLVKCTDETKKADIKQRITETSIRLSIMMEKRRPTTRR